MNFTHQQEFQDLMDINKKSKLHVAEARRNITKYMVEIHRILETPHCLYCEKELQDLLEVMQFDEQLLDNKYCNLNT